MQARAAGIMCAVLRWQMVQVLVLAYLHSTVSLQRSVSVSRWATRALQV